MTLRQVAALLAVAVLGAPGTAATVTATPGTFAEVLNHAAPGDAIRLQPGVYEAFAIKDRHWSPSVKVDATGATLRGIRLNDVGGLDWHGGTFDGNEVERNGFNIYVADHIAIDGATFSHLVRNGIGLGMVSDVRVTNNVFTDSGSDGIDIAMSRRVVVDHNRCGEFHPTPGAHPDCIQMWSHPEAPPTADITITNNEAIGAMAGITGFNHIRNGVDDGGFDRITVEHNYVKVSAYHGITIAPCRNCVVRHNRAETRPDPQFPHLHTWIKTSGEGTINCDNIAADWPRDPGTARCRDGS